ncbi:Hsp20 family protein [Pseudidiomarina terrestris]|uniref:Hsp20 family protein n=1 Tax=Pseudidiomarina terrestris TaxID=2820060 RepID=A0ABT8MEC4_9GAMM|nr:MULTISPECIES: Hsp20 family protein [unclassified Pseudidiomarina]MDN7128292.1 Hsp20 family protein [Pseudidiomarina sp. 1APR75-15]MDN7135480.1 Hsp20 family protein [Pseudidiomarina sp. 1ASP75-5]
MATIDLSPLYRSSIGFDRMARLLDSAMRAEGNGAGGYPPYNIEVIGENRYAITVAVAGFSDNELSIEVENGILKIQGRKEEQGEEPQYLHKGIGFRTFERKFNLADHVEVKGAKMENGLLTIGLEKIIPEAMKPRKIEIGTSLNLLEDSAK